MTRARRQRSRKRAISSRNRGPRLDVRQVPEPPGARRAGPPGSPRPEFPRDPGRVHQIEAHRSQNSRRHRDRPEPPLASCSTAAPGLPREGGESLRPLVPARRTGPRPTTWPGCSAGGIGANQPGSIVARVELPRRRPLVPRGRDAATRCHGASPRAVPPACVEASTSERTRPGCRSTSSCGTPPPASARRVQRPDVQPRPTRRQRRRPSRPSCEVRRRGRSGRSRGCRGPGPGTSRRNGGARR